MKPAFPVTLAAISLFSLFLRPPHFSPDIFSSGAFSEDSIHPPTAMAGSSTGINCGSSAAGSRALTAHICWRSGPTPLLSYFKMSKPESLEIGG